MKQPHTKAINVKRDRTRLLGTSVDLDHAADLPAIVIELDALPFGDSLSGDNSTFAAAGAELAMDNRDEFSPHNLFKHSYTGRISREPKLSEDTLGIFWVFREDPDG